jgi:hypothetical protein
MVINSSKQLVQTKQLSETYHLGETWDDPRRSFDYLLIASGNDYRSYEIARRCKQHNIKIREMVVFDYEERRKDVTEDRIKEYDFYKQLGFDYIELICSENTPSICIKKYAKSSLNFAANSKVAIDISCFTKPYVFSLMKFLKEEIKLDSVAVFYTEPMSYMLSRGLYNSYHSTVGSLSVMEIPGFPGVEIGSAKKILVVLLGFDGELASFITEEVSPEKVIIVNGFPSYVPKFKDISLINNERLINYSNAHKSLEFVRANDPFATYNLLESLISQEIGASLTIAPIGTQPMALGACMFAIMYQQVRIIYPYPEKYASITTDKCWNSWSYQVPLVIK